MVGVKLSENVRRGLPVVKDAVLFGVRLLAQRPDLIPYVEKRAEEIDRGKKMFTRVALSKEEEEYLDEIAKRLGMSKHELIRLGAVAYILAQSWEL